MNFEGTHQQSDDDLIDIRSMAHNTALHFPVTICDIHNLTGSQFNSGQPGKSGSDYVRFRILTHFACQVEPDGITWRHVWIFCRFDCLDYSRLIQAFVPGCHHPGAQDGPLGQPLTRWHPPVKRWSLSAGIRSHIVFALGIENPAETNWQFTRTFFPKSRTFYFTALQNGLVRSPISWQLTGGHITFCSVCAG